MTNYVKGPLNLDEYLAYRGDGLIPENEIDNQIEYSMVLDGSTDYLSYTPAGVTDSDKKFFISTWVEVTKFGSVMGICFVNDGGTNEYIQFTSSNTITFKIQGDTLTTSRVFKDTGFYHIVGLVDTTLATTEDRMQLWVNGERVYFASPVTLALNTIISFGVQLPHSLGSIGASSYLSGYIGYTVIGLGQTATISDFGQWDHNDWKPKKFTGSVGTTGSLLEFANNSNLGEATVGADWTVNGTPFRSKNTPTNQQLKFSIIDNGSLPTLQNGANTYYNSSGTWSTSGVNKKFYKNTPDFAVQFDIIAKGGNIYIGFVEANKDTIAGNSTTFTASSDLGPQYLSADGNLYAYGGTGIAYGSTYTTGDKIMLKISTLNSTFEFLKLSGSSWVSQGVKTFNYVDSTYQISMAGYSGTTVKLLNKEEWVGNYGNADELKTSRPASQDQLSKNFETLLYTGTGAAQTITGTDWGTDDSLVWIKNRDVAYDHYLMDGVRGVELVLRSNTTGAETSDNTVITAYNSDGFDVSTSPSVNGSGNNMVAWRFRAGQSYTNTKGSISSTVSHNRELGFSIVKWTGTGATGTIGHGGSSKPCWMVVKRLDGANNWVVYDKTVGATDLIHLDLTNAATDDTGGNVWADTEPTSSVFTVGNNAICNASGGSYIAYVFFETDLLKHIDYTGNGSTDGPLVELGIRPEFIIRKDATNSGRNWLVFDTIREPSNPVQGQLELNSAGAEADNQTININGTSIKMLTGGASDINTSAALSVGIAIGTPTVLKRAK